MKKHFIILIFLQFSCVATKKERSENLTFKTQLSENERINLLNTLQTSLEKFETTVAFLTTEQLNFKSNPKKWSINECIEHVTLAEIHFSEIVNDEMKKPSNPEFRSKIKIKDDKIRPKMLSKIWKAKSPEVFKPSGKFKNPKDAIIAFSEQRLKTIEYIKTTQDDLRNHFWKHPLTGNIDLYQTLLLMSAHLERHLNQIENIKSNPNFPIG